MKRIYIKPLKIGQICTINGHVYQAKKDTVIIVVFTIKMNVIKDK